MANCRDYSGGCRPGAVRCAGWCRSLAFPSTRSGRLDDLSHWLSHWNWDRDVVRSSHSQGAHGRDAKKCSAAVGPCWAVRVAGVDNAAALPRGDGLRWLYEVHLHRPLPQSHAVLPERLLPQAHALPVLSFGVLSERLLPQAAPPPLLSERLLSERLLPQAAAQDLLLAAAGEVPVRQVSAPSRHGAPRAFTSPQRQQGKPDSHFAPAE